MAGTGRETVRLCKLVRPIMSTDFCEARRRALGLYRAFYRYIPYIVYVEPPPEDCIQCDQCIAWWHDGCIHYVGFGAFICDDLKYFDIPKSEQDCRCKIREYFYKNACVTDIRVIDLLVLKGYMELKEITHSWSQKGHIMAHWQPTLEPKPCDFIGKFLNGVD